MATIMTKTELNTLKRKRMSCSFFPGLSYAASFVGERKGRNQSQDFSMKILLYCCPVKSAKEISSLSPYDHVNSLSKNARDPGTLQLADRAVCPSKERAAAFQTFKINFSLFVF